MSATPEATALAHLTDAQCADLVLGLAPAATRERWLDHATTCEACAFRLRSHVGASERARADAPVHRGGARVTPLPSPWRGTSMLALAAAAVLAVAVALPMLTHAPLQDTSVSWLPGLGESIRTRESDAEDPRLTRGMAAYEARDLVSAERELSAARASGASETLRRLYLAHVRLAAGRARESVELLRSLNWRSIPEPYRRDGAELLARALRASGDSVAADTIESRLRTIPLGIPFIP